MGVPRLRVMIPEDLFNKDEIEAYLPVKLVDRHGEVEVSLVDLYTKSFEGTVTLGKCKVSNGNVMISLYEPAINSTLAAKWGVKTAYTAVLLHELSHLLLDPIFDNIHKLPHDGVCVLKRRIDAPRPCHRCIGLIRSHKEEILGVVRKLKKVLSPI